MRRNSAEIQIESFEKLTDNGWWINRRWTVTTTVQMMAIDRSCWAFDSGGLKHWSLKICLGNLRSSDFVSKRATKLWITHMSLSLFLAVQSPPCAKINSWKGFGYNRKVLSLWFFLTSLRYINLNFNYMSCSKE